MSVTAEIIAIGDELLVGEVLDTNSHWLCAQLTGLRADVRQVYQLPDEGETRRNLTEADLMNCMVALPGQLFYSTQISVRNWIDDSFTCLIHSEIWKN